MAPADPDVRIVGTAAKPYGGVGGVTGTFSYPPVMEDEVDDRTPDFPLGRRAIAENRRLLRKQLERCGRKRSAAKRTACRSGARERFVV